MAAESILVIDDDGAIRRFVTKMLTRAGYRVIVESGGKAGVASYRNGPADLVITDLVMWDLDGLETISELRALKPDVKIIAISGHGDQYLEMARRLGAQHVLLKPFEPNELLELVRKALS